MRGKAGVMEKLARLPCQECVCRHPSRRGLECMRESCSYHSQHISKSLGLEDTSPCRSETRDRSIGILFDLYHRHDFTKPPPKCSHGSRPSLTHRAGARSGPCHTLGKDQEAKLQLLCAKVTTRTYGETWGHNARQESSQKY